MKKLFLILILLIVWPNIRAQNSRSKSAKVFQSRSADPIEELRYNLVQGKRLIYSTSDSFDIYASRALELADSLGLYEEKAKALFMIAGAANMKLENNRAIEYYKNALALNYEHHFMDDTTLFDIHAEMIFALGFSGKTLAALNHYDTAVALLDPVDSLRLINLNHQLSYIYGLQGDYREAVNLQLQNLKINSLLNDTLALVGSYYHLGYSYCDLNLLDSSNYYFEKSLAKAREWNYWDYELDCLSTLGFNYLEMKDYETSLDYFNQWEDMVNLYGIGDRGSNYAYIAKVYYFSGQKEKAKEYSKKALDGLGKITNLAIKKNNLIALSSIFIDSKDFENAVFILNQLQIVKDSLSNIQNREALSQLEIKYQTREQLAKIQKQEAEMALLDSQLDRQRIILISIILLSVMLLTLIFVAWRNIRQEQKINKKLEEMDRTKSRFFTNVSHELRTPLTLVLAPLEDALHKVKSKSLSISLSQAYSNAKKLLNLVEEILDLSKLSSERPKINLRTVKLSSLLKRIFYSWQSMAQLRNIVMIFDFKLPEHTQVKLDVEKFEKILNNLLSNAFKHSSPGDKVTLETSKIMNAVPEGNSSIEGDVKLNVVVRDTGRGIHQDDQEKIFDRFYQSSSEPMVGGTGVGLALSKELSALLDGSLKVESKLGKGSAFSIELPYIEDANTHLKEDEHYEATLGKEDPPVSPEVKSQPLYSSLLYHEGKPRILIVEDDMDMSKYLVQSYSEYYHCTTAFDGRQALEKLEKETFDLITCDVMMPVMDGFELLGEIRKPTYAFRDIPVIMLTARILEEDKLQAFSLGVDDYITKPFSSRELLARIDNLLKNKVSRDELKNESEKDDRSHEEERAEKLLLKKAEKEVNANLHNPDFSVEDLATALNYSTRHLGRLIKQWSGLTPVGFIREMRLQKAYQMFKNHKYLSVSEVRYEVGIDNASYFTRKFKERFGINPTEILN